MSELLTSEESKGLIALCRAGKLYEVDKWITSGKSIQTPPEIRKTPLHIAIDLGFHSLVELLARHESRQEVKNQGLSHAVSESHLRSELKFCGLDDAAVSALHSQPDMFSSLATAEMVHSP